MRSFGCFFFSFWLGGGGVGSCASKGLRSDGWFVLIASFYCSAVSPNPWSLARHYAPRCGGTAIAFISRPRFVFVYFSFLIDTNIFLFFFFLYSIF